MGERADSLDSQYDAICLDDDNRIVLEVDEDAEPGADYINASMVEGMIATQSCLQSTRAEFWQMVYEQNGEWRAAYSSFCLEFLFFSSCLPLFSLLSHAVLMILFGQSASS